MLVTQLQLQWSYISSLSTSTHKNSILELKAIITKIVSIMNKDVFNIKIKYFSIRFKLYLNFTSGYEMSSFKKVTLGHL